MVRDYENVVKDDNRFRLLGRGMVSPLSWRNINLAQVRRSQFYWRSRDSENRCRKPRTNCGRRAIDGSQRRLSIKNAACGWAVAQMVFDGGDEPWYGVGRVCPCFRFCRKRSKRAEIRPFYMALCKLCGCGNRAVVQALKKGEVHCTQGCGWSGMRSTTAFDKGMVCEVVCTSAHATFREKAKVTPEKEDT